MSEDGVRTVRVEIFGEEYAIRTDMDEDYTRECARYVDELMQDAHLGAHVSEPHRAAVLVALQITDRLFQVRAARKEDARRVREAREEVAGRLRERLRSLRQEAREVLEA